eukprot:13367042-Heterocapsa_arctica.AAC.1
MSRTCVRSIDQETAGRCGHKAGRLGRWRRATGPRRQCSEPGRREGEECNCGSENAGRGSRTP